MLCCINYFGSYIAKKVKMFIPKEEFINFILTAPPFPPLRHHEEFFKNCTYCVKLFKLPTKRFVKNQPFLPKYIHI